MRKHRTLLLPLALAICTFVGCNQSGSDNRATAEIPALKVVPENALGFILWKDVAQCDAKVAQLSKLVGTPIPAALPLLKGQLGIKEGFDEHGTLVFVAMPGPTMPPPTFACIPTTDYKKLIAGWKPEDAGNGVSKLAIGPMPVFGAPQGSYAVIGVTPGMTAADVQAYVAAKANITPKVSSLTGWLAEQDFAAVVTNAGVKAALGPVRQGLDKAKQAFPAGNPQAEQIQGMFAMYDKLFQMCDSDLEHAGIGGRFDGSTNLHIASSWQFKKDSTAGKALTDVKGAAIKPLTDLPGGPYLFAGGGILPDSFGESMVGLFESMMPGKLTDADRQQIRDAMQQSMKGVRSMGMTMGVPKEGSSIYSGLLAVVHVDDADQYLATVEKIAPTLRELYKKTNNPALKNYDLKSVTVSQAKGLEMTFDMSSLPQADETTNELFKKLFGADGKLHFTYAVLDKNTLIGTYTAAPEAAVQLDAYRQRKGSLADDGQAAKTLGQLLPDAQWVGVFDLGGTLKFAQQMTTIVAPGQPVPIPTLPACPPLGFAARAQGGALQTDLVIPADTLKAGAEAAAATRKQSGP